MAEAYLDGRNGCGEMHAGQQFMQVLFNGGSRDTNLHLLDNTWHNSGKHSGHGLQDFLGCAKHLGLAQLPRCTRF